MHKLGRAVMLVFVMFVSVGCDRATKTLAQQHLSSTEPLLLFNGTLRLRVVENPGAFLSIGARLPETFQFWIFVMFVCLVLAGLAAFLVRNGQKMPVVMLVAFGLLLSGGMGNLIDRLTNDGRVVDFINLGIGNLRTGIFNVADMAIMAGVVLIAWLGLRSVRSADTPMDEQL